MICRDLLTTQGYIVLEALTAEEAFEMIKTDAPDLILMDIQLPGIDGLDAVRELRQSPATSSIPIVALTAHALPAHREKALAAGCSEYITKPIRSSTFRETIRSVLERRGKVNVKS